MWIITLEIKILIAAQRLSLNHKSKYGTSRLQYFHISLKKIKLLSMKFEVFNSMTSLCAALFSDYFPASVNLLNYFAL